MGELFPIPAESVMMYDQSRAGAENAVDQTVKVFQEALTDLGEIATVVCYHSMLLELDHEALANLTISCLARLSSYKNAGLMPEVD